MKTLAKSIAAMAATSAIAVCALITAVSASSDAFNSSVQSETNATASHIQELKTTTFNIGGTSDGTGYTNNIYVWPDINCYNINGGLVSTNEITRGLTSTLEAPDSHKNNYKYCGIYLKNNAGKEKTVISLSEYSPNLKKVQAYNSGPGGTLKNATYTFCIYDNPDYSTNSYILGKVTLDVESISV